MSVGMRVAGTIHALFLVAFLVLELGAGFVAHIPIAALAGVTAWMGVALLLNRGFCGWQAVFYHLNRGQYAILPLNRGQTFCHRKEVVLSIAVVFKIVGTLAFLRSDRRPRQSSYVRLVSAARLTC